MSGIQLSRQTNQDERDERDKSDFTIDVDAEPGAKRNMMHWVPVVVPMMATLLASMAAVILSQLGPY